jgi:hypothetical protein
MADFLDEVIRQVEDIRKKTEVYIAERRVEVQENIL